MAAYPFPWDLFVAVSRAIPGGRRSLRSDSELMVSRIRPQPVVVGAEHIPPAGPLLIAANHYQRRGLWIAWPGAVVTLAVAERRGQDPPVHWLATAGLRLLQWRGGGPEIPFSRALFRRVAGLYSMAGLPVSGSAGRAAALRTWLHWVEQDEVIGIFPEGLAGRSDGLCEPEPGFTTIARLLAVRRVPVLPVAIHERSDTLHVEFGHPLVRAQEGEIMGAIAALLPAPLRGPYAGLELHGPVG